MLLTLIRLLANFSKIDKAVVVMGLNIFSMTICRQQSVKNGKPEKYPVHLYRSFV